MARALLHLLVASTALSGCLSAAPAEPLAPPRASSGHGTGRVTAFVDVDVVPTARGPKRDHQTILVEDGVIRRVGPKDAVTVPPDAVVIAGAGKYVMPGMADMHVHLPTDPRAIDRVLDLSLAHGVTVIRSMQGAPEHLQARARLRAEAALAPTLYLAGPPIARSVTAAEARETVLAQKAAGYDFIKLIGGFDAAAYDVIVDTARDAHFPVCGHVPPEIGLDRALAARQASVEHEMGYMEAATLEDPATLDALARRTREAGVSSCPTLDYFAVAAEPDVALLSQRDGLRYVAPADVADWKKQKLADPPHVAPGRMRARERVVATLSRAGARLLVGSDSPGAFSVPGFAYVEELHAFQRAGLAPAEILRAATLSAAEYFGAEGTFGAVAEGMRADLVLLDGDPLADLDRVAHPAGVMVGGRWLPRGALEERLAQYEHH